MADGELLSDGYSSGDPNSGIEVTSSSVIADNALVRGAGGLREVQGSGIIVSDDDELTGVTSIAVGQGGLIMDGNVASFGGDITTDSTVSINGAFTTNNPVTTDGEVSLTGSFTTGGNFLTEGPFSVEGVGVPVVISTTVTEDVALESTDSIQITINSVAYKIPLVAVA